MNDDSFCGDAISTKRGLLASLWSIVTMISAISFLTAFIIAMSSSNEDGDNQYYNYNNNNGEGGSQDGGGYDPEVAVTSRALAFSALWTGVLAALLSVFGTGTEHSVLLSNSIC